MQAQPRQGYGAERSTRRARGLDVSKRHGTIRAADGTVTFELTFRTGLVRGAVGQLLASPRSSIPDRPGRDA